MWVILFYFDWDKQIDNVPNTEREEGSEKWRDMKKQREREKMRDWQILLWHTKLDVCDILGFVCDFQS